TPSVPKLGSRSPLAARQRPGPGSEPARTATSIRTGRLAAFRFAGDGSNPDRADIGASFDCGCRVVSVPQTAATRAVLAPSRSRESGEMHARRHAIDANP